MVEKATAKGFPAALVVTIDGPAGAGKTTVSRQLALCLGYRYIDTGALYRAVAMALDHAGVAADDDPAISRLLKSVNVDLMAAGDDLRLMLNGQDITDKIRTPEITMLASAASARLPVRKFLLEIQRDMASAKRVVLEGRDMGTVVLPDADIKFFLDAAPGTRARRRHRELQMRQGDAAPDLDQVEADMRQRDHNDSHRDLAPLKPAADAIIIDSTSHSVDQVVETMVAHIRRITLEDVR